VLEKMNIY